MLVTSPISRKSSREAKKIPHYHGHRQRLRDRFLKTGFSGLAEHEVLEILLTLIIPRKDVKEPAKELLSRFGNLYGVLNAPFEKLQEVDRIGAVAPVAFQIIREATGLYLQQEAERSTSLTSLDSLSAFWRIRLGNLPNEVFEAAYLDSASTIQLKIHDHLIVSAEAVFSFRREGLL